MPILQPADLEVLGVRFFLLLAVSVSLFSLQTAYSDQIRRSDPDWYNAFDLHPDSDKPLVETELGAFNRSPSLGLEETVHYANDADCDLLKGQQKDGCFDVVNVMMYPEAPVITPFGKQLREILEGGKFDSPQGLAIQEAFSIDRKSLQLAEEFHSFKNGYFDEKLLPFFRFYSMLQNQDDDPVPPEVNRFISGLGMRIKTELNTASAELASAHKRYAQGVISYRSFFNAYRRYFQARYVRNSALRLAERAGYIGLKGKFGVREEVKAKVVMKTGGSMTARADAEFEAKRQRSLEWIVEGFNFPYTLFSFYRKWDDARELSEQEMQILGGVFKRDFAGLLSHLKETRRGKLGLLTLYDGFAPVYFENHQDALAYYKELANQMRQKEGWGGKTLFEIAQQVQREEEAESQKPTRPSSSELTELRAMKKLRTVE